MFDYFDPSQVLVKVFLLHDGDLGNQVMLTKDHLAVVRKGKKHIFKNEEIKKVALVDRKWLFPLLAGGIMSPIAFLSYFSYPVHPMIHLVLTLIGIVLFYTGWVGRTSLFISAGEKFYYELPSISPNLNAFVAHVNGLFQNRHEFDHSYIMYFHKDDLTRSGFIREGIMTDGQISRIYGFTSFQLKMLGYEQSDFIAIDLSWLEEEVKFEYDPKLDILRPVLNHRISPQAIVKN